jgi:hypothetical protein
MVRRTDPELDCVMKAARPLDVGARDAFLRELEHFPLMLIHNLRVARN